ncbi:hypothetical protein CCP3SC1AL1_10052 [Gammaproteobacteria bacterium]
MKNKTAWYSNLGGHVNLKEKIVNCNQLVINFYLQILNVVLFRLLLDLLSEFW